MSERGMPGWIVAADAAALRLEAEVGPEIEEILGQAAFHGGSKRILIGQATRLEQSAELTEVATDLAGLLWAEHEVVPPIASILDEPAAQGSLAAVAAARRAGARRLVAGALVPPAVSPAVRPAVSPPVSPAVRPPVSPAPGRTKIWPERPTTVTGPLPRSGRASGLPGPVADLLWIVRRISRPQT